MALFEHHPPLASRVLQALRTRGPRYTLHRAFRRIPGRWTRLKRAVLYHDARAYWSLRGGPDYFREQEDHPTRAARSAWIARRIAGYRPRSILEIGCGYGKQLHALRGHLDSTLVGLDFSPAQLDVGRDYLQGVPDVSLVLGDGQRLPFPDQSFDLVLTSAVILHNAPAPAEQIRREILRVARRWAAHNEDRDITYNRYGYDTAAWYADCGIPLAECGPIPDGIGNSASQFCVAELCPR